MVVASAFAAMAPGRMFPHYLQLMFFPLGLLSGIAIGAAFGASRSRLSFARTLQHIAPGAIVLCFLLLGVLPQVIWRSRESQPSLGRFSETHGAMHQTTVSQMILRYARAGESMGM